MAARPGPSWRARQQALPSASSATPATRATVAAAGVAGCRPSRRLAAASVRAPSV